MEVLRRYSNQTNLLESLRNVLRRIEERDRTDVPGVKSAAQGGRWVPLEERLRRGGVAELVAARRAGARLRDLAERYGISESTVKPDTHASSAFVVSNTGPVVPAYDTAGLFEPFRRMDSDRLSGGKGVGLRLSIVRSVARARTVARSTPSRGPAVA